MTENLSSIRDPELRRALRALFARQTFGIKLGLEPTLQLLEAVGNPHRGLNVVHVAGTNGKGSVCALAASVLAEAGLRVGLYSSPHLVNFRERMKVNGRMISEERLAGYAREMMPEIERIGCTFFEGTTAMALRYFAEEGTDVVVLETGMGGRLDSTNVVTPIVSAITSIGLDHTKHLGESYEQIAREKGGIIKPGVPAVVGRVRPRLRPVFSDIADAAGAPLLFAEDRCRALYRSMSFQGTVGSFVVNGRELDSLLIGLVGVHQVENARVALTLLDLLAGRFGLDDDILRRGFASVKANTGIAGRFDRVRTDPDIVLDVAHNPDGAAVLADTLRHVVGEEPSLRVVFGAVRDKDIGGGLNAVAPLAKHLYAVSADNPRSLPSDEIAWWGTDAGIPTTDAGSVAEGLARAVADAGPQETVLVFGSFFVVGEAIEALEEEGKESEEEGKKKKEDEEKKNERPAADPEPSAAAYRVSERIGFTYTTTNPVTTMNTNSPDGKINAEGLYAPEIEDDVMEEGPAATGPQKEPPVPKRRTMRDWSASEQPRERLMVHGAHTLTHAELIAILLRTGTRDKDVLQLSREILHAFGDDRNGESLVNIAGRDFKELQQIGGIGPTKAVTLAAAFELGKRVAARPFGEREAIRGPEDVARIFIPRMRALHKEQFHVIILNTAGQIIRTHLVSEGTLNSSVVHPREVYRTAIIESAAAIIGLHNHPSGNPQPSKEDIAITKQLVESGRVLGIPFHDHIIIAGEEHVSMVDKGLM